MSPSTDVSLSKSEIITIKGSRNGLLVTLRQGTWEDLKLELARHLADQPAFFKGGRVSLNVGDLTLAEDDIRQVRDLLIRHDVMLHAVVSRDAQTEAAAQRLGLVINLGLDRRPPPAPPAPPPKSDGDSGEAKVIRRTLRSGQAIQHPGHVVIIGDVNPGAEIAAKGHVVVWGALRGIVHAGVGGDEKALICALDMSPTQLRIAGHITRAPDEHRRKTIPEVASVRGGQIVVMPWR